MRLIRSAGETITPSDDGRLFRQMLPDGVFGSLSITVSGGNIVLPAFKGIMCGRDFSVDAMTLTPALPTGGTVVSGKIIVRIDLTQEAGSQLSVVGVLNPYTLTTDNINESGGVLYEIEIGTYKGDIGGVTEATSTAVDVAETVQRIINKINTINNYLTNKVAPIAQHNVTYARTADGDGIYLQGGGTTIIGAGEVAQKLIEGNINNAQAGTNESVHIAADDILYFYSRCQNISERKQASLDINGNFNISNGGLNASGVIKSGGKTVFPLTYKDIDVNLHTTTFTSATGLYYAEIPVTGWKYIYALTIEFWGGLPGFVQPYIVSASRIGLMSAVQSFPSSNATVTIRIVGERITGD